MKSLISLIVFLYTSTLFAAATVGQAAPTFNEKNQAGETAKLEDYKGNWLVLEWYNEGCPYVKKHYGSKNMQKLQKKYTKKGVKWLTVATSAEGKQGYVAPTEAQAQMKKAGMNSTALLLDADGSMGKAYGAKTTPHMFVINPAGQVVYAGAIDSNNSANPKTIKKSKNYVSLALDAGMKNKPIKVVSSKPYGCSVKY